MEKCTNQRIQNQKEARAKLIISSHLNGGRNQLVVDCTFIPLFPIVYVHVHKSYYDNKALSKDIASVLPNKGVWQ